LKTEHDVHEQFLSDLPKDERKNMKARDLKRALALGDEHVEDDSKPKVHPGVIEIEDATAILMENENINSRTVGEAAESQSVSGKYQPDQDLPLHPWLLKFKLILMDVGEVVAVEADASKKMFLDAELFRRQRRFEDADELFDESLFMLLDTVGHVGASGSSKAAEIIRGKADIARVVGRHRISRKLYHLTMHILRKSGESVGEIAAHVYYGLAELTRMERRSEDALPLYTQAIAIQRQVAAVSIHISAQTAVIDFRVGQARAFLELGMLLEAEENLLQALKYREQQSNQTDNSNDAGANAEEVAEVYALLGRSHTLKGDFIVAGEHIDRALALIRSKFGDDHHSIAEISQIRAEYKIAMGKLFDARKEMGKALSLRIKSYGSLASYNKSSEASAGAIAFLHVMDELIREDKEMELRKSNSKLASLDFWEEYERKVYGGAASDASGKSNSNNPAGTLSARSVDGGAGPLSARSAVSAGNSIMDDSITIASNILDKNNIEDVNINDKFNYSTETDVRTLFQYKKGPVSDHPLILDALFARGEICYLLGDYDEAKELLDGSVTMSNNLFGNGGSSRGSVPEARAMVYCGLIVLQLQSLVDASRIISQAHTTQLQLLSDRHPDRSDSSLALGRIKLLQCKFDESLDCFQQCLSIRAKLFGENHYKCIDVMVGIAEVKRMRGELAESSNILNRVLFVSKQSFGDASVHPVQACVLHALAETSLSQCYYDSAGALFEQSMSIRSMLLGDDHPDTMASQFGFARVLQLQGKLSAFKKSIEECFTLQKKRLGKLHRDTVTTMLYLGCAYLSLCKYSVSTPILERVAVELPKQMARGTISFGSDGTRVAEAAAANTAPTINTDHSLIAQVYHALGDNFCAQANYTRAKECHTAALNIRRRVFGERHAQVASSIHRLALINLREGFLDDAVKQFDDALAIRRLALGSLHADIAESFHGVALGLTARGRFTDAITLLTRAHTLQQQTLGPSHASTLETLVDTSVCLRAMGQLEQALANFHRYLPQFVDTFGSTHPIIARNLYLIGETATMTGNYEEGRRFLCDSLDMRRAMFEAVNPNHPDLSESITGLADNLRCRGILAPLFAPEGDEAGASSAPGSKSPVPADRSARAPNSPAKSAASGKARSKRDGGGGSGAGAVPASPLPANKSSKYASAAAAAAATDALTLSNLDLDDSNDNKSVGSGGSNSTSMSRLGAVDINDLSGGKLGNRDDELYALPLYERAFELATFSFGEEHTDIIKIWFGMAETLKLLGRYREATNKYKKVMLLARRVCGDDHPFTVEAFGGLAEILRVTSKIFSDEHEFEEAIAYKALGE
jgi:tetratricopeptide (TPR) repeat protein